MFKNEPFCCRLVLLLFGLFFLFSKDFAENNYQDNRNSNYHNEIISVLNEYKTELIQHGINDSEINSIINSPQDKQKLEYFVEKYEPILRTIEVASAAVTLFDLLLKFL